ncbi:MAG: DUF2971 domain-containing protein [Bacteroidetes bacterium]|nr:DUF2971 domain-containing protein [Bacteroidota bacterium]
MIDDQPPNKLYKYRHCDANNNYQKLLRENLLFFSSPKNFNDPFDCRIYPNFESGSTNQLLNRFLDHIKSSYPNMPLSIQKSLAKKKYLKNIKIIKSPELMTKRMNEVANKYYGIFSLAENVDNLLMWAHYSDCHRGFCIEFDANRLLSICNNYLKIQELIFMKKIKYESEYPIISPFLSDIYSLDYIDWITTKSKDWEYEREWRLIFTSHPDEEISFPEDIFTGIYFGVNATCTTIENIKRLFSNKNIKPKYYQAKLKHKQFGVAFSRM